MRFLIVLRMNRFRSIIARSWEGNKQSTDRSRLTYKTSWDRTRPLWIQHRTKVPYIMDCRLIIHSCLFQMALIWERRSPWDSWLISTLKVCHVFTATQSILVPMKTIQNLRWSPNTPLGGDIVTATPWNYLLLLLILPGTSGWKTALKLRARLVKLFVLTMLTRKLRVIIIAVLVMPTILSKPSLPISGIILLRILTGNLILPGWWQKRKQIFL